MEAGGREMFQVQICLGRVGNDFLHRWVSSHCFGPAVAADPAPPAVRDLVGTETGSSHRIADVWTGT